MGSIVKNHFALSADGYRKGIEEGRYQTAWPVNLSMVRIPATPQNYHPLVRKLGEKWGWDKQPRYQGASLAAKLSSKDGALYLLKDGGEVVGYALASAPSDKIRAEFFGVSKVIEIENLGLFPGKEGGGRGKAYFEMLFAKYFPTRDVVYWSQHETHAPTLRCFYEEKMGMTLLKQELVPDFRTPARAPTLQKTG